MSRRSKPKRCALQLDLPPVLGLTPTTLSDTSAAELGVSPAERSTFDDAFRRLQQGSRSRLRAIYAEATGDAAGSGALSGRAMIEALEGLMRQGERGRIQQAIARELAGLAEPPSDVSSLGAYEQTMRLLASSGDELQTILAMTLGADRARELRVAKGGWPWSRWGMSGCPDER